MNVKQRIAVGLLTLSAAGFSAWQANEGFTPRPVIPTRGDAPTIGHGSTRYEDGTPVTMADAPITRKRAEQLARNLLSEDERRFRASIPDVALTQAEYDLYLDFIGQYGIGNWRASSMRRHLLSGEYAEACDALLMWRKQAGRDCALPENWGPQGCRGVWTRQLARHEKCEAAQ